MQDEWREGSGSTSSAGGRGSNPTSASGLSVPYRGQRVAFPLEFFAPQQSGGSNSQEARGRSGSRGRGGLGQGSGTSSGVQAPTEVGQQPPPDLADWTLQDALWPLDTAQRPGTRRPTELQSDSRGTSQSLGSKRHKARHRLSKDNQISSEARMHCRRLVLAWFKNHSMIHLEKRFLNDGERGLDEARRELQNLIFLGMVEDEWDEDRPKFGFEGWIDSQVNEAILNATVVYYQIYGEGSTIGPGEKPQFWRR